MPTLPKTDEGKRICQVIKVRPEHLEEYKKASVFLVSKNRSGVASRYYLRPAKQA